jgi:hypothetical protein
MEHISSASSFVPEENSPSGLFLAVQRLIRRDKGCGGGDSDGGSLTGETPVPQSQAIVKCSILAERRRQR